MNVIDLFSGLGGFSQAFVDRGHNVERYDFDKQFGNVPFTMIKDVLDLTPSDIEDMDIILASPPCNHFSIASNHIHWPKSEPTEETKKQIVLVKETILLIARANPKYWILENPRGMMRRPEVLGRPEITTFWGAWGKNYLKPTDLWGKFPPIDWQSKDCATWERAPRGSKKGIQGMLRNPAQRALIPYDFSMAVCLAVEGNSQQRTLEEFSK